MQKNEDASKLTTHIIGKWTSRSMKSTSSKAHPHCLMVVIFHDCKTTAAFITKYRSIKPALSSLARSVAPRRLGESGIWIIAWTQTKNTRHTHVEFSQI